MDFSRESRLDRYFELSSRIAHLSDAHLLELLDRTTGDSKHGWGASQTLALGRRKVFVKRVPVTELEFRNPFSTKNLFDLPIFYNYGVGSAGLGVWRELVVHIKSTNWVLAGEIELFPLMYAYRIVPRLGGPGDMDMEWHERYVRRWAGSEAIGKYMLERGSAPHELLLFLEYFPFVLNDWLIKKRGRIDAVLEDIRDAITFLRGKGVLHFDAHLHNFLTDGERCYLSDFGLALDKNFDLSKEERAFFMAHSHYDYGEALEGLAWLLPDLYSGLPASRKERISARFGIHKEMRYSEILLTLMDNLDAIDGERLIRMDPSLPRAIRRYEKSIRYTLAFFLDMHNNDNKDTPYNDRKLKSLLKESGFLP